MTVEQFANELQGLGQSITRLDDVLLAAGGRLVEQLRAAAPVDTGDLKNSIQAVVENNQLQIQMLVYGMFQNYGVKGTEDSLGITVPEGVSPFPRSGDKYSFQTRRFGLPNQTFFNVDAMADVVAEAVAQNIIENL